MIRTTQTTLLASLLLLVASDVALARDPRQTPPASAPRQAPPEEKARAATHAHERTAWDENPFAVEAHFGIATPSGLVGLGADVSLLTWLSLDCRLGTNLFGAEGGCGARVRVVQKPQAATYFGLGASLGPHVQSAGTRHGLFSLFIGPLTQMSHTSYATRRWNTAHFMNLELGQEYRQWTGFVFRMYLGAAFLLNADAGYIDGASESDEVLPVSSVLAYGGVAVGWAL